VGDEAASAVFAGDAGHRLVTEHLPDLGLIGFDHDLRIRIATGAAVRANGFEPTELVGRRLPELARQGDAETLAERCRAALAGERSRIELPGSRNPGTVWMLDFTPLRDRGGAVTAGMMIARDVTDERRSERIVRASQRQLAEAQRVAQMGSWEWDPATDRASFSDEMRRIFGIPPGAELTAELAVARVHPADVETIRQLQEKLRADPSPVSVEHRIVRPDGTVRTILGRGEGVVDESGRVVRVVGINLDVTERRRADEERRRLLGRLYELQEGQDRQLAADLHDGHIQSLAAIGFKLEQARLRLGAGGSPEVHDLLRQVTERLSAESEGLRRTIGRLRPLAPDAEGLEAALREEARTAEERAALAACEVVSDLGRERLDPAVETALFRVAQQALANVVEHAAARNVMVGLGRRGDGVVLWVDDDGRGFDPEHVRALGDAPGFGLLAMRERVEALGGSLWVRTRPGGGTRIEAWMPHTPPADEGAEDA
jgi:two-component system, NarL family, sensor histidine kinase UhpB